MLVKIICAVQDIITFCCHVKYMGNYKITSNKSKSAVKDIFFTTLKANFLL